MISRPREPIESRNEHDIKPPAPRVSHQAVQLRPAILRARDADVDVLVRDGHATVAGVLSKREELRLRVLPVVLRRDAGVQGNTSSFIDHPPTSTTRHK